jgi:hypothetical protein
VGACAEGSSDRAAIGAEVSPAAEFSTQVPAKVFTFTYARTHFLTDIVHAFGRTAAPTRSLTASPACLAMAAIPMIACPTHRCAIAKQIAEQSPTSRSPSNHEHTLLTDQAR